MVYSLTVVCCVCNSVMVSYFVLVAFCFSEISSSVVQFVPQIQEPDGSYPLCDRLQGTTVLIASGCTFAGSQGLAVARQLFSGWLVRFGRREEWVPCKCLLIDSRIVPPQRSAVPHRETAERAKAGQIRDQIYALMRQCEVDASLRDVVHRLQTNLHTVTDTSQLEQTLRDLQNICGRQMFVAALMRCPDSFDKTKLQQAIMTMSTTDEARAIQAEIAKCNQPVILFSEQPELFPNVGLCRVEQYRPVQVRSGCDNEQMTGSSHRVDPVNPSKWMVDAKRAGLVSVECSCLLIDSKLAESLATSDAQYRQTAAVEQKRFEENIASLSSVLTYVKCESAAGPKTAAEALLANDATDTKLRAFTDTLVENSRLENIANPAVLPTRVLSARFYVAAWTLAMSMTKCVGLEPIPVDETHSDILAESTRQWAQEIIYKVINSGRFRMIGSVLNGCIAEEELPVMITEAKAVNLNDAAGFKAILVRLKTACTAQKRRMKKLAALRGCQDGGAEECTTKPVDIAPVPASPQPDTTPVVTVTLPQPPEQDTTAHPTAVQAPVDAPVVTVSPPLPPGEYTTAQSAAVKAPKVVPGKAKMTAAYGALGLGLGMVAGKLLGRGSKFAVAGAAAGGLFGLLKRS